MQRSITSKVVTVSIELSPSLDITLSLINTTLKVRRTMAQAMVFSGSVVDFPFKQPAPFFAEEKKGWKSYIEWERYPDKKAKAAKILSQYDFSGPPEFQMYPLP